MRMTAGATVFALALGGLFAASTASAQQAANPAHTHIGHVLTSFRDTPNQQGLLPTALTEARTAAQHAGLANRDPANLNAMKLHAGHVLHALDPSQIEQGPGAGYGLKKAAQAVAQHITLASNAEGASQNVKTHANHVATSANNTVARADKAIELVKQIQAATEAGAAATALKELVTVTEQLVAGLDANSDGQVGWQEGEGGLAAAEQHMNLMKQGEGLP
ncbi:MAG: hypothetical protein HY701_06515 [Gemmatimonadetes bacterium]|nr:hypothetical protein [Gemmatimonadota bacterium]